MGKACMSLEYELLLILSASVPQSRAKQAKTLVLQEAPLEARESL